jgi:cell wall-associated NlpC family hydrolase
MIEFEKYLGLRWKTGGRELSTGLDCWGLLRHVYRTQFGILLPEYAAQLGQLASPDHVEQGELQSYAWFETESPTEGDVVALGRSSGMSHVGIYLEVPEPAILHIALNRPSMIATIKDMARQGFSRFMYYRHVDRLLS